MKFIFISLFFLELILSFQVKALASVLDLQLEIGKTPFFQISNKGTAKLVRKELPYFSLPILVSITKSDCIDPMPSSFVYNLNFKMYTFSWEWVTHFDPKKIKQTVNINFGSYINELTDFALVTNLIEQGIDKNLPQDSIEFEFSKKQIHVLQWLNQNLVVNLETGKTEEKLTTKKIDFLLSSNRDNFFGVHYSKNSNNNIELTGFAFNPFPFSEKGIWLLNIDDSVCELNLKIDSGADFLNKFYDYIGKAPLISEEHLIKNDDDLNLILKSRMYSEFSKIDEEKVFLD